MENLTETLSTGAQKAQDSLQQYYADSEQYVRKNPTKSALVAMGAGFLLAQLPLRWMFVAFIKIALLLIKPATFIYAISKLIDDVRAADAE